jgi:hypothetical protein
MPSLSAFLRVALTVAVMNGVARVGFAYWSFFQLKDHAQQTAVFGGQTPTDVLQYAVLEKAHELLLPVTAEQVVISRVGPRTLIRADYEQPIEYFPSRTYPMKFSFAVEGFTMGTGAPVGPRR